MSITIDHIIEIDDFSEADMSAIREALDHDQDLALAFGKWLTLSEGVSERWRENVPSRQALVLLALKETLDESTLTVREQELLSEAESQLSAAIENHPAVQTILNRIKEDSKAFDVSWNAVIPSVDRVAEARRYPRMRLVRMTLAAAAVVVTIALGVTLMWNGPSDGMNRFATASGELRRVTLDDGTVIRLQPDSQISWDDDFQRHLFVKGEAFFEVSASPVPFIVDTHVARTTVLGTSFGLRSDLEGATEVILVSGRVSIFSVELGEHSAVILEPGDQGIVTKEGIVVEQVELADALSWTELIVFRNTDMKDVAKTLSDRFQVTITLTEGLEHTPLTGTFEQDRGVREILEIIASALGATLEVNDDTSVYILSR